MIALWSLLTKILLFQWLVVVNAQMDIGIEEFASEDEIMDPLPLIQPLSIPTDGNSIVTITHISLTETVFITVTETFVAISVSINPEVPQESRIALTASSVHEQVPSSTKASTSTSTIMITRISRNIVTKTAIVEDFVSKIAFDLEALSETTAINTSKNRLEQPIEKRISVATTATDKTEIGINYLLTAVETTTILDIGLEPGELISTYETRKTMSPEELLEGFKPYKNLPIQEMYVETANGGFKRSPIVFGGISIAFLLSCLVLT